jgi:hypothetical protein
VNLPAQRSSSSAARAGRPLLSLEETRLGLLFSWMSPLNTLLLILPSISICSALTVPAPPSVYASVQQRAQHRNLDVADLTHTHAELFPVTSSLADGATAEETEGAKDRARLAGLGALAFGILPSVYASSLGVPGAFDKKKDK